MVRISGMELLITVGQCDRHDAYGLATYETHEELSKKKEEFIAAQELSWDSRDSRELPVGCCETGNGVLKAHKIHEETYLHVTSTRKFRIDICRL